MIYIDHRASEYFLNEPLLLVSECGPEKASVVHGKLLVVKGEGCPVLEADPLDGLPLHAQLNLDTLCIHNLGCKKG